MATVTANGISPLDLTGYISRLNSRFQERFGQDLDVAGETPQGGIIGIWALALAEMDETLVHVSQGMSIQSGVSIQLDEIGGLLNIPRLNAQKSTVSVNLSGTSGTTIPIGSRASTADNNEFELIEAVTIPSNGRGTGIMRSIEVGPIPAGVNTLTRITNPIAGWEGINNPTAAVLGRARETDVNYRLRLAQLTSRIASSTTEALEDALIEAGATIAKVHVNDTNSAVTIQNFTIPRKTVLAIVKGTTDDIIKGTVLEKKGMGVGTIGNTNPDVTVTLSGGGGTGASGRAVLANDGSVSSITLITGGTGYTAAPTVTIAGKGFGATATAVLSSDSVASFTIGNGGRDYGVFQRVNETPITVAMNITTDPNEFPANGIGDIKDAMVAHAARTFRIGETINQGRLEAAAYQVPGHEITTTTIRVKSGATALPATPNLDVLYTLAKDDIADPTIT